MKCREGQILVDNVCVREYPSKIGYRVTSGNPSRGTALDIVKFEYKELGNKPIYDQAVKTGIPLKKYPATNTLWVTRKRKDAEYYLTEEMSPEQLTTVNVPTGSAVLAEDNQGGYLILHPKHNFKWDY